MWNKPFNCVLSMSLLAPTVLQAIGSKDLFAGSATTQPSDAAAFTAEDLPLDKKAASGDVAQWLQPFDLPAEKFTYTLRKISSTDRYEVYRLVYPSSFKSESPENNVVPRGALSADLRFKGETGAGGHRAGYSQWRCHHRANAVDRPGGEGGRGAVHADGVLRRSAGRQVSCGAAFQ